MVEGWQQRVRAAASANAPLRIVGGSTKDFYGQHLIGELLDVSGYAGIVDYDPTELVITARCGTRLTDIESAMAASGQMLAFEPPHFGSGATIGGCIAAGLSGPRRAYAGAVRDLVLGIRLLDGRGEDLAFGGRVMKNVAGFDVSRLVVGALGTLGIILEVSLKCVPLPRVESTRVFELDGDEALRKVNEWGGAPLPLSASCWYHGRLHVRLSGAESAVKAAERRLGGEAMADAAAFWASIREQSSPFFGAESKIHQAGGDRAPLDRHSSSWWRLSVRSIAPYAEFGADQLVEWGGALRWVSAGSELDAHAMRAWAARSGGHATLFRAADKTIGVFQPLPAPMMALHQRVKAALDPAAIFNRGRMYADL